MWYEGEPGNDTRMCLQYLRLTSEEGEDGAIPQETWPAGRPCGLRLCQDRSFVVQLCSKIIKAKHLGPVGWVAKKGEVVVS